MMEERYHATTQNWFYPDMSNVNKNITAEAKLISPPTYKYSGPFTFSFYTILSLLAFHFTYCKLMHYFFSLGKVFDRTAVLNSVAGEWIRIAHLSEFSVTW